MVVVTPRFTTTRLGASPSGRGCVVTASGASITVRFSWGHTVQPSHSAAVGTRLSNPLADAPEVSRGESASVSDVCAFSARAVSAGPASSASHVSAAGLGPADALENKADLVSSVPDSFIPRGRVAAGAITLPVCQPATGFEGIACWARLCANVHSSAGASANSESVGEAPWPANGSTATPPVGRSRDSGELMVKLRGRCHCA